MTIYVLLLYGICNKCTLILLSRDNRMKEKLDAVMIIAYY
jgi:hypothetical protein